MNNNKTTHFRKPYLVISRWHVSSNTFFSNIFNVQVIPFEPLELGNWCMQIYKSIYNTHFKVSKVIWSWSKAKNVIFHIIFLAHDGIPLKLAEKVVVIWRSRSCCKIQYWWLVELPKWLNWGYIWMCEPILIDFLAPFMCGGGDT